MKTIIVTGASKGVGLSIVSELLVNTKFQVVGLSRTLPEKVAALCAEFSGRYFHHNVDLANPNQLPQFFKEELKKYSPIVGLVNNAACAYDDIVTNLQLEPLRAMFELNVYSPMLLTKLVLRNMLLHKVRGSIVHISSISAHTGYKGLSMYAASKGAMEAFSKNTAREWGSLGVRSNVVCPGFMETEMSAGLESLTKNRIYQRTSLKQPTELESVAKTVNFLLSSDSASITGTVVNVDSGTI